MAGKRREAVRGWCEASIAALALRTRLGLSRIRTRVLHLDGPDASDPDGRSRELGQEFDVVVSFESFDDLYLDLVAGVFDPGAAFGPGADRAWIGQVTMTYEFW